MIKFCICRSTFLGTQLQNIFLVKCFQRAVNDSFVFEIFNLMESSKINGEENRDLRFCNKTKFWKEVLFFPL